MKSELDPAKSAGNKAKHGMDFVEAQALWQDAAHQIVLSKPGVANEVRFLAIGRIGGKHWTAIWTGRGDAVRIISVRRAREEEIGYYEGS